MAAAKRKSGSARPAGRKTRTKVGGARVSAAAKSVEDRHEDDHIDGCDFEFHEADATRDQELPPARGGVAPGQSQRERRR